MGLLNFMKGKTKDGNLKMLMSHLSGLPNFPKNAPLNMILDSDKRTLIFEPYMRKDLPTITLPLSKITNAGGETIEEIKNQSKAGRAIVGGLLFGSVGAVVGALTADEKKKIKLVFAITYQAEDEEKTIILGENGNMNYFKFKAELEELLHGHKEPCGNITL